MVYKALADMVVIIHLAWILFLLVGAFWGVRNRVVRFAHLGGLVFALVLEVFRWYCPLTYLEVWLRGKHNPSLAYPGSFIAHYAEKIVYLELSWEVIFVLTLILCGINAWVYLRRKK